MGRILGVFLLFENAALVAMPPVHDSEIASTPAASVSSRAYARRISSPVVNEPFDAGQIPPNRYFIAPDLVGFRSEIPIVLWPGIVDKSRLEVRS